MKNKFSFLWIFSGLLFAFASCKKPVSQLALYVPKDAASVFTIDAKAIQDKLSSSGITIDSLANIFSDKTDEHSLHWSDIKNSGIDLNNSFFLFSKESNSIQGGSTKSFGFIAQVEDKTRLIAFFKKQNPGADVMSDTKYQYFALGKGYVAGWNDKILIISNVTSGTGHVGDEALSHQQLTALFTQNESSSIASVGEFRDMLKKTGDIHFWANASANIGALGMLGMTKIGTLFQDTYTEGAIDFENGKVIAAAESHYNKTLSDILEKYPSREIDKNMIGRYPNPINGFGIVSFNPKVLIDILNYLGFNAMSDSYLSQMGFTTNDIVNAFKGDIAVIFSDFKMEDRSIPNLPGVHSKRPGGQFLLNAVIGDKDAFNRVMAGLVKQQILSKNGDQYELGLFGGHDFVIETTNDNLFIASDDALVKAYQSGNNKSALLPDVEKEIGNKSMAMYVDVAAMLQKINSTDTSGIKTTQAAQATFKNFIAYTDKGDGKTTKGSLELNTVNASENSLASLAKFISIAHEEDLKHEKHFEMHPPFAADSIPDTEHTPGEKDSE
jgi:hypothetical protein